MTWRWLAVPAVILGAVVGCRPDRPELVADARQTILDRLADAEDSTATARLQKPEGDRPLLPASFLDTQPAREGEQKADRRAARIWATVNGKPILEDEVRESSHHILVELRNLPEPLRSQQEKELLRRERDRLIEQELLLQDAYRRLNKAGSQYLEKMREAAGKQFDRTLRAYKTHYKLKTDEELKNFLRSQGLSLDGIRRQKEREFIATEYLRSRVMPAIDGITPAQLLEYYQQHAEEFMGIDRVQWQDIFIDTGKHASREAARQFAEQLARRAEAGEDFARLAEQHDNGYSRTIGGAGAGQVRGEISPPDVEPVLFQLREGTVGPLVELATGFHIVKVVKREHAGRKAFDEKSQSQVRDKLRNEIANREAARVIADLRRRATIEVSSQVP